MPSQKSGLHALSGPLFWHSFWHIQITGASLTDQPGFPALSYKEVGHISPIIRGALPPAVRNRGIHGQRGCRHEVTIADCYLSHCIVEHTSLVEESLSQHSI